MVRNCESSYESQQINIDRVCNLHKFELNPLSSKNLVADDDLSSDDGYHGLSPPPPYEDLLEYRDTSPRRRRDSTSTFSSVDIGNHVIAYNDVGEEINVTITTGSNREIGLTFLSGQSFTPNWPAILDIKTSSAAHMASPKISIGDQIKEINGMPTENLANPEILGLFSKSRDTVQLLLRRGVEPTKREFDWFKFPFLSVSRDVEKIEIVNNNRFCSDSELYKESHRELNTFKEQSTDLEECSVVAGEQRFGDRKVQDGPHYRHVRSMSASAVSKGMFVLKERRRRKTIQENVTTSGTIVSGGFRKGGMGSKLIASEVEMRQRLMNRSNSLLSSRKSSLNSLASSTSTISSYSSNSTTEIIQHNHLLTNTAYTDMNNSGTLEEPYAESANPITKPSFRADQVPHIIRAPVNKLRNSFRKRGKDKNTPCNENEIIIEQPYESTTLSITVWVPDRRRLGIKLGGGSVSPYGDSNISIMEVKKTGTAHKVLRTGDEILEVDGKLTTGLDVYEVNKIIKHLEGNYVELKIFRPTKSL